MRKLAILVALAGFVFGGCSDEPETAATPPPLPQNAPGGPQPFSGQLKAVNSDLAAKNYRAAAERMRRLSQRAKSAEEDLAYRRAVYETHEALRRAAERDAAAREAYENFGRAMMGR